MTGTRAARRAAIRVASCVLLTVVLNPCAAADDPEDGLSSPVVEARERALDRIIAAGDPDSRHLERLGALLEDADPHVAAKAAHALAAYGAAAFPRIEALLERGSPAQRRGATLALYHTDVDVAPLVPLVVKQLYARDDPLLLRTTLAVLARLGTGASPALAGLAPLLAHEDDGIRRAALAVAAAAGPAAHALVPAMLQLLDDPAPEVRVAAADAVARVRPPAPVPDAQLAGYVEWLRTHVPDLMREHHVPGMSIAVVHRNAVHWAQGFGVRDARGADPVTTETVFEACSLSKPVTALGALRLVEEGRLSLDAPLTGYLGGDYLRDEPAHRRITARMALTHRTGLPNWRTGYAEAGGPLALRFPPGSEDTYSGEGILFLQRAMEAVVGLPLERYMHERFFEPLGLAHTSYVWTEGIERDLASGHDARGAFLERTRYRKGNGAYSLYTTPTEFARLMLVLADARDQRARLLAPATVDAMVGREILLDHDDPVVRPGNARSVATYRALGWSLEVTAEGDILHHYGSNSSGFKAFAQLNRAKGSGLVIFANSAGAGPLRDAVIARIGDL